MATNKPLPAPFILGGFGALILGSILLVSADRTPSLSQRHNLTSLAPALRARLAQLIARMAARGIRLVVGSTKRDAETQAALVAAGRSATHASKHLTGEAVDVYPVDPATGQVDVHGKNEALYRTLHAEWAALGGKGLAFTPYPSGPKRYLQTNRGPVWDAGHLTLS